MKNNIMIIVIVTMIAICVIAAVIVASIINSDVDTSVPYIDSSSQESEISLPDVQSSDVDAQSTEEEQSFSESTIYTYPESSAQDPESSDVSDAAEYDNADDIVVMARSLIDTPFADNGESPETGFDNSGFIYYVLRENGYITCPRIASEQSKMGARRDYSQLKKGDLVFFRSEETNDVGYGGIFIGDGMMIACMMPGTNVREVDISTDYYQTHFYCGVSLS